MPEFKLQTEVILPGYMVRGATNQKQCDGYYTCDLQVRPILPLPTKEEQDKIPPLLFHKEQAFSDDGFHIGSRSTAVKLLELGINFWDNPYREIQRGSMLTSYCDKNTAGVLGWGDKGIKKFPIGYVSTPGDPGFAPSNVDEMIQDAKEHLSRSRFSHIQITQDGDLNRIFIYYVEKVYNPVNGLKYDVQRVLLKTLANPGKGIWVANTLEDCKELALAYAVEIR